MTEFEKMRREEFYDHRAMLSDKHWRNAKQE
jgi:hypothetical protein